MYTTQTGQSGIYWHHNGDYSGDVIVRVPSGSVTIDSAGARVEIPFEDIRELVANYVRNEKIARLETRTAEEVLLS
jgi:GTPase involved in cell partitioning and DNA repair